MIHTRDSSTTKRALLCQTFNVSLMLFRLSQRQLTHISLSNTMYELVSDIGVYPVPPELSTSNLFKGWLLIVLFILYVVIDLQFAVWIRLTAWIVPQSTGYKVRRAWSDVFWQSLLYLINKRKIKIIISGINLKDETQHELLKNCVVVANHKSLFDYMLLHYLKTLVEKATGETINLNLFNWNALWFGPSVKLLVKMFRNDENWQMNVVELENSLNDIQRRGDNNWIAHFPEVNICTQRNLTLQNQQLGKNLLPKFKHLLYPRFNNFSNLTKTLGSSSHNLGPQHQYSILGLTILYYNPVKNTFTNPMLFEILTLKQPVFIIDVDFRLKGLNKLPMKLRKLEKWLENEWCEKDKILDAMEKQLKMNVD